MYVVENQELDTFDFSYQGQEHSVPLTSALPFSEMLEFEKSVAGKNPEERALAGLEMFNELLVEYAPNVASALSVKEFKNLAKAYTDACSQVSGE